MRKHVVILILASLLLTPQSAYAFSWKGIWNGVKSGVSAPFKAAGWLGGQVLGGAADAALDGTFDRIRESTDYAANKFGDVFKDAIKDVDDVAKARLNQLDDIAKQRLDQIDHMLDTKLAKVEEIADKELDKATQTLDRTLTRVETLTDTSLNRLDALSDRSLSKLSQIENDAMNRVDSAVQDQLPFMASKVAREMERWVMVIVFIAVLLGYGGLRLYRGMMAHSADCRDWWPRLRKGLQEAGDSLLSVGVPMLVVAIIIQVAYECYLSAADHRRVARLDHAAEIFEKIGEYRTGGEFRRRALALNATTERRYHMLVDQLLAGLADTHTPPDWSHIAGDVEHLSDAFGDYVSNDANINAVRVYLATMYGPDGVARRPSGLLVVHTLTSLTVAPEAKQYVQRYLASENDPDRLPALGKLVYVCQARLAMAKQNASVHARIEAVRTIADALVAKYPSYAPGLVLRAQLTALKLDADQYAPSPAVLDENVVKQAMADRDKAEASDPEFARFMRLSAAELPDALAARVVALADQPADKRPAAEIAAVQVELDSFSKDLAATARPLVGWPELAKAEAERLVYHAIRSSIGRHRLQQQVDAARKTIQANTPDLFTVCIQVAESAEESDQTLVAEDWMRRAADIPNLTPEQNARASALQERLAVPLNSRLVLGL